MFLTDGRARASIAVVHIQGLLFACGAVLFSKTEAISAKCSNISSRFKHCEIRPDGVRDVDCFGKYGSPGIKTCVWKPGTRASQKSYSVAVLQQRRGHCILHESIHELRKSFDISERHNLTVEVVEHGEAARCTKAVFQGSPKRLMRCGPPKTASFRWLAGTLHANASWSKEDAKAIENYNVRFKPLGGPAGSQSLVRSGNRSISRVDAMNSSLVYSVQLQCVSNEKCWQCPWSDTYTVPAELTAQPVIVQHREKDVTKKKGCRLISVTWKFPDRDPYDLFYVTVRKASGETPGERTVTSQRHVRLLLSYSSYQVDVSAVNNVSVSPAASLSVPRREGTPDGRLNVTVHHNISFTVFWRDDLVRAYECYSVEWWENERNTLHMSFHEDTNNYRTLSPLPEPLKPYRRYSITLHTRTNNDTCNMVQINNSESTYGSTRFYFAEGSPVGAPANVSTSNVTLHSAALRWSRIPEEDARGFLLGYVIHYAEHRHGRTSGENNVTVDPSLDTGELTDLKSGTAYQVRISGFTSAGAGVRSAAVFFKTKNKGRFDLGLIGGFVVVSLVMICATYGLKRIKVLLWPSIPNPEKSSVVQTLDAAAELELAGGIDILSVEEWDVKSLHVLEREMPSKADRTSVLTPLNPREGGGDSPVTTPGWVEDTNRANVTERDPNIFTQTNTQASAFAFNGGYTTVEMFQRGMSAAATPAAEESSPDPDLNSAQPGPAYMKQFSHKPSSDSEQAYTIL